MKTYNSVIAKLNSVLSENGLSDFEIKEINLKEAGKNKNLGEEKCRIIYNPKTKEWELVCE